MASVVSKLKTPSGRTEEESDLTSSVSVKQLEQLFEQAKGLMVSIECIQKNTSAGRTCLDGGET
jgi:hypothetical protein